MMFLVTQIPKRKYSGIYRSPVGVFEAKTATEAVRLALATDLYAGDDRFTRHEDFKKPMAAPLVIGKPVLV